ncbi:acyl-CoA dehydrogenase family protein [Streptomyces sp. NPDC059697]|uniref:acyl-CoA dehydrogenase family protein n=1 Tax=Streptomyces sp. NPDC059697 TaxID=3346912 RepID=UPI003683EAEB
MNAVRAAPATSGAFAVTVIPAAPPRTLAQRKVARPVPSASTRHPETSTTAGAALRTAVQRRSSARGRRVTETTAPVRTHNRRSTASPGETVTSTRPAKQLATGAADPGPDADGVPRPGSAVPPVEALAEAVEEALVEALVGPDDGPRPAPPDPPHAASSTTPATAVQPAHHRIARLRPSARIPTSTSMPASREPCGVSAELACSRPRQSPRTAANTPPSDRRHETAAVAEPLAVGPHSKEAAMAKLYASEVANQAASASVRIHGGYGYVRESEISLFYADAKILEIGEGTNEIRRNVIARALVKQA